MLTLHSSFAAILCLAVLHHSDNAAAGCASGFLKLDVLSNRAKKISAGNTVSPYRLDGEFRLIPDTNFTCSGTITSLLLGVDIRTVTSIRNQYPEVQIWRQNDADVYDKIANRSILLAAGDFSPDGVLRYTLRSPLHFQSGDVLGVYQPADANSVVRLFYSNDEDAPVSYWQQLSNPQSVSITSISALSGQHILIHPETDPPQCTSGFLSPDTLRQKTLEVNINSVVVRQRQQRVFPDIHFTCNGSITKWIVGAYIRSRGSEGNPELQIWRTSGTPGNYIKINSTQLTSFDLVSIGDNVYEYNLSSPLEFQQGDMLGVYYGRAIRRVVGYNQDSTGPKNYRHPNRLSFLPAFLTAPVLASEYDYPLVTVVISTPTATIPTITTATSVSSMTAISTTTGTTISRPDSEGLFPLLPSPEDLTPVTTTLAWLQTTPHNSTNSTNSTIPLLSSEPSPSKVNLPIIIVLLIVVVILSAALVCTIITVIFIFKRQKRKQNSYYVHPQNSELNDMRNRNKPTLNGNSVDNTQQSSDDTNVPSTAIYETPEPSLYFELDVTHQCQCHVIGHDQPVLPSPWGFVVPTMSQRRGSDYSTISANLAQEHCHGSQSLTPTFFEETLVYWEPGSDCESIYQQLAEKKFREVIRDQIHIVGHLGSGQFGWVDKGVWHSPEGPVEVAIKTLKAEASEEKRVKFLQEAAIMGQFHHPNIVQLIGVVTVGEPVMILIELMKSGDLKHYLHTLRPIPGELVPSTLPQQLLGYCRQIASGMEYLSKKSFVHRDLAARNILMEDGRTCKIADFGMSRDMQDESYYISSGGKVPVKWTAPEAVLFNKYSTASDVWSFGVLMFEIWSLGHKPFGDTDNSQVIRLVNEGYRLPPPPGCTRALYKTMLMCWHPEKSSRPSFASLVSEFSQPESQLLEWSDSDRASTHFRVTMLGAPLEFASNLHSVLQNTNYS